MRKISGLTEGRYFESVERSPGRDIETPLHRSNDMESTLNIPTAFPEPRRTVLLSSRFGPFTDGAELNTARPSILEPPIKLVDTLQFKTTSQHYRIVSPASSTTNEDRGNQPLIQGSQGPEENVIRYGIPFELQCYFQKVNDIHEIMARPKYLGILSPGNLLEGALVTKKLMSTHSFQDNRGFFALIPEVALGAKERIMRQIKRINKYRAGLFSASRLDDNADIRRNIENLEMEIKHEVDKVHRKRMCPIRFGDKVNLLHLVSKRFVSAQANESGCSTDYAEYVPFHLRLTYEVNSQNCFIISPYHDYQKKGKLIKESEPFQLLYYPSSHNTQNLALRPLFKQTDTQAKQICLGSSVSGFFAFKFPVPSLSLLRPSHFMSYAFMNLTGGSLLIKHREKDLFLTLVDMSSKKKVRKRCLAVRAKMKFVNKHQRLSMNRLNQHVNRLQLPPLSSNNQKDSQLTSKRTSRRSFYQKPDSNLQVPRKRSTFRMGSQVILGEQDDIKRSKFELFLVSKQKGHKNYAALTWEILPSRGSPNWLFLRHIGTGIKVGPLTVKFLGQHQDGDSQNIYCELETLSHEKFSIDITETNNHRCYVKLADVTDRVLSQSPSSYDSQNRKSTDDGFSSITFSLQVVDCVSDLKVRFATEAYFELISIYKETEVEFSPQAISQNYGAQEEKREKIITRLNALLKKAIEFLRNNQSEMLTETQDFGKVSEINQNIFHDLGFIKPLLSCYTKLFMPQTNNDPINEESNRDTPHSNSPGKILLTIPRLISLKRTPEQDGGSQHNTKSRKEEDGVSLCFQFLLLYVEKNPCNAKEIFIYHLVRTLISRKNFRIAPIKTLALTRKLSEFIDPYFDFVEQTFEDLGDALILRLKSSKHMQSHQIKKELLLTLEVVAQTLRGNDRDNLCFKLLAPLVLKQSYKIEKRKRSPQRKNVMGSEQLEACESDGEEDGEMQIKLDSPRRTNPLESDLLINMIHNHITAPETYDPEHLCDELNRLNDDFVQRQIQLYAVAHPIFSPNFENTQVSRAVKLLKNYAKSGKSGNSHNKVRAGLLHLLNVLITKNTMLQIPIPCTLRFLVGGKVKRVSDVDALSANCLSRKNIEKILELDRVLSGEAFSAQPGAAFEMSDSRVNLFNERDSKIASRLSGKLLQSIVQQNFLNGRDGVEESHIELIKLYNSVVKIAIAQNESNIHRFISSLLKKYLTFWGSSNLEEEQAESAQLKAKLSFPSIMGLDLKILRMECGEKYQKLRQSCAQNQSPFLKRLYSDSFAYLQTIQSAKQLQRVARISGIQGIETFQRSMKARNRFDSLKTHHLKSLIDDSILKICEFLSISCSFDAERFLSRMGVSLMMDQQIAVNQEYDENDNEQLAERLSPSIRGPHARLDQENIEQVVTNRQILQDLSPKGKQRLQRVFILLDSGVIQNTIRTIVSWLPRVKFQSTKNKVFGTVHELSTLRLKCLHLSSTALYIPIVEQEYSYYEEVINTLTRLDSLIKKELSKWKDLEQNPRSPATKESTISAISGKSDQDFQESIFLDEKERVLFETCQKLDILLSFLQTPEEGDQDALNLDTKSQMFRSLHSDRQAAFSQNGSHNFQSHPVKSEAKYNKLLQGFFRQSHGYQVILQLILQSKSLLTLAINSTYLAFKYGERHQAPVIATLMFELTTKAYNILTLFVSNNSSNTKLLAPFAQTLIPYYGDLYMISCFWRHCLESQELEEAIFNFQAQLFLEPSYLFSDFTGIKSYVDNLRLKLIHNRLPYSLRIFSNILRRTLDPEIINIIIDTMIYFKSNPNEHDYLIKWDELPPFLNRVQENLKGKAFEDISKKLKDFARFINEQVKWMVSFPAQQYCPVDFNSYRPREMSFLDPNAPILINAITQKSNFFQRAAQKLGSQNIKRSDTFPTLKRELTSLKIFKDPSDLYKIEKIIKDEMESCFKSIFIKIQRSDLQIQQESHLNHPTKRCCCCCCCCLSKNLKRKLKVFALPAESKSDAIDSAYICSELIQFLQSAELESKQAVSMCQFFLDRIAHQLYGFSSQSLRFKLVEMITRILNSCVSHFHYPLIPASMLLANKLLFYERQTTVVTSSNPLLLQDKFFDFFNKTTDTNVLGGVHTLIRQALLYIQIKSTVPKRLFRAQGSQPTLFTALVFLKNLCEDHNSNLQSFLREQPLANTSYDFIGQCLILLQSTLEAVAFSHGMASKSKAHESVKTEILKFSLKAQQKSKLKETYSIRSRSPIKIRAGRISMIFDFKGADRIKSDRVAGLMNLGKIVIEGLIEFVQGPCLENQARLVNQRLFSCFKLVFQQLAFRFRKDKVEVSHFNIKLLRLKSQMALLIMSVIEGRSLKDPLVKSTKSEVFLEDLEFILAYNYFAFSELAGGRFMLDKQYFPPDDSTEFHLQDGFTIFFLLKRILEGVDRAKLRSEALKELNKSSSISTNFKKGVCKQAISFVIELCNIRRQVRMLWKQPPLQSLNKKQFYLNYHRLSKEGIRFFSQYTSQVQIYHEHAGLMTIYFPKAPSYAAISPQQKSNFLYSLSADENTIKVDSIVAKGEQLLEELIQQYKFRSFFTRYPLFGMIIYYSDLWKTLAFYLSLILNFLVFVSYTRENGHQFDKPTLFLEVSTFQSEIVFDVFGALQILFSLLGNFTVTVNRIPFHLARVRSRNLKTKKNYGCFGTLLRVLFAILTDLSFLYSTAYMIFAFIGFFIHHFYYSYHLVAIFARLPEMRNIMRAIWKSGKESLLILLMFFIIEYFFTIIAYQNYYDDIKRGLCLSVITCFLTLIDQTFKNNGGIGVFLDGAIPDDYRIFETTDIKGFRIFYDSVFNLILLIMLVQLYAAVIIDTFSALRAEKNTIEHLMRNNCVVCGQTRQALEQENQSFEQHIRKNHNVFNYVRFLAYLKIKENSEFTGLESYVASKVALEDHSWFPIPPHDTSLLK